MKTETSQDDERIASKKRRVKKENDDDEKKAAMRSYLALSFSKCSGEKELWEKLPDEWKKDEDVARAAYVADCMPKDDAMCYLSVSCFRELLADRSRSWDDIPKPLCNDEKFANSCLDSLIGEDVMKVVMKFQVLADNRNVWLRVIHSNPEFRASKYLKGDKYAPAHIKADYEIMLAACRQDCIAIKYVSVDLIQNKDFVGTVLSSNPRALKWLQHGAQRMFQDLAIDTFARFPHQQCVSLADNIAPELWENRNVVEAWLQAGFHFSEHFPDPWKTDEQLCFLLAANWSRRGKPSRTFKFIDLSLRGNKDFMMRVLAQNAFFFRYASKPLQLDFDVALLAFASSPEFAKEYKFMPCFPKLKSKIASKLRMHELFFKVVLCPISLQNLRQCVFAKLNQGEVTGLAYKRLLAEYLDVPTGRELRLLRRASLNLASPN